MTAYRVAYLQRGAGAASSASGSTFAESPGGASTSTELQKNFTLDIVFVVDTTRSMQPWIDAVKQVIAEVAGLIDKDPILAPRVRLGLVAYRDVIAGSGMEYVTKIVCDLPTGEDHPEFQRHLSDVHEAEVGSEDYAEEMLAGLHVAVKLMESLKTMSQVTGDVARGNLEKAKQQGQQAKAGSDESLLLGPVLVRLHASESDTDEPFSQNELWS